jgi:endonuclease/exonuclease/phosphatase (EEP) superfamily protein YafD
MRGALSCALFLGAISCGGSGGSLARSGVEVADFEQRPTIRVMTYNVNYGLAGDDETLAAIRRGGADVVLLQETNAAWERVLRGALARDYLHMDFRHCCTAGGLAVLSRHPFTDGGYLPARSGWFPAWRVIVRAPVGELQLLNVHLRPQIGDDGSVVSGVLSTPPVRVQEMVGFYPELQPALPTIVAGDFNESRSGGAVAFLEERGFRNALPQMDGPQSTWRWPTSLGEIRLQLDHLVYRRLRLVHGEVVEAGRSDHLPVVGVFAPAEAD